MTGHSCLILGYAIGRVQPTSTSHRGLLPEKLMPCVPRNLSYELACILLIYLLYPRILININQIARAGIKKLKLYQFGGITHVQGVGTAKRYFFELTAKRLISRVNASCVSPEIRRQVNPACTNGALAPTFKGFPHFRENFLF